MGNAGETFVNLKFRSNFAKISDYSTSKSKKGTRRWVINENHRFYLSLNYLNHIYQALNLFCQLQIPFDSRYLLEL